ncbi:hypothetical protein EJ04DRAFT_525181 [Polyplosphaeria fusca]|uniref:F-box domain-containing protein n=1 Tax=Polyplosphaeria fusca TaxID=682080 RepID=A0A9P4QTW2_9PLEO|nr:hypothetical protein EJ04DRAFT_525181 [Polyplosphaeria fusca]
MQSPILRLPNELLFKIAASIKGPDRQKTLLGLALNCKHLRPIAQEELCGMPSLSIDRVPSLVSLLVEFPGLSNKIESLKFLDYLYRLYDLENTPGGPYTSKDIISWCSVIVKSVNLDSEMTNEWMSDLMAGSSLAFTMVMLAATPQLGNLTIAWYPGKILTDYNNPDYVAPVLKASFANIESLAIHANRGWAITKEYDPRIRLDAFTSLKHLHVPMQTLRSIGLPLYFQRRIGLGFIQRICVHGVPVYRTLETITVFECDSSVFRKTTSICNAKDARFPNL